MIDNFHSTASSWDRSYRPQQTLVRSASIDGFGYWSGRDVHVEFAPAPCDTGIVFIRTDLPGEPRIKASVAHRVEVPRRTNLVAEGISVEMVEHLLAALAGLHVDNCEVRVNAAEMPGLDGSCIEAVEALLAAEIVEQEMLRPVLTVGEICRVGDETSWVEARPSAQGVLSIKYRLDYAECPAIGRQTLEMEVTPESFRQELAPARTFIIESEAQWLQSQGMCQRATYSDLLVFGDEGPIENETRFDDECVRHKALDLVGDLSLAGCDLVGQFFAHRSGHRLNAALVQALLTEGQVVQPLRCSA